MIFFISLLLVVWSSLRWTSRLASSPADGFWVFVAGVMLQLGAIASLTSSIHQLTPAAWVLVQVLVCAVTLKFMGGMSRPTLLGLSGAWSRLRSKLAAFASELSPWGGMALLAVCGVILASLATQAA